MRVIAAACLGAAAMRVCAREPRAFPLATWAVPFVLLTAYVAVQACNPSHVYSKGDAGLTPMPHVAWLPHSVDRFTSASSLM